MKCCEGKGWKSWLMMLGCLLPIIILIAAPLFGIQNQYITWLAFLACPLAMGFMMLMNKDEKKDATDGGLSKVSALYCEFCGREGKKLITRSGKYFCSETHAEEYAKEQRELNSQNRPSGTVVVKTQR